MDRKKVEFIVREALAKFPNIHGTIMVSKGNELIYHKGFSYVDAPFQTDKSAQYLIASLTKQFTAAAILRALYDNKLEQGISESSSEELKGLVLKDLQSPLSDFLDQEHLIWNGAMPEWSHQVTLHHLLTHTSGVKSYNEPLEFIPSENYAYSNVGYILIGEVIQEITREPLEAYFKRVLFDPAQMNDTYLPLRRTFLGLKDESKFQKLSLGFESNPSSTQRVFNSTEENIHFDKLSTSGAMVSTAQDLVKWNQSFYNGHIIPSFLVNMMVTKHTPKETYSFYDGSDTLWYGYGLDIHEERGERVYQHCGGTRGYQGRLSYNPKTNITIVNLSNISEEEPSIFTCVNRLRDLL